MKPLQTTKNTGMGYSAAYPTGAERCLFQSKSNRGKFSLDWLGLRPQRTQRSQRGLDFEGSVPTDLNEPRTSREIRFVPKAA